MALVNAWSAAGEGGSPGERFVVLCDNCIPPTAAVARDAEYLSEAGWEYADPRRGPHACSFCTHNRSRRELRRRSPPEQRPALPNVVVVGAAKCGTTSLHRYLAEHPEVHMSPIKELNFFVDPGCLGRLEEYASFFDERVAVRGESSPLYSMDPLVPGVPDRVREAIPDAKLIYLVRDPIERIESAYVFRQARSSRVDSLERALGMHPDAHSPYIAPSRYAKQLELYLRHFDRHRVLVVDQAELLGDRREALRRVFGFLGVDEGFWSPRYERREYLRDDQEWWSGTATRLAHGRLARAIRRAVPDRPRRTLLRPARAMTTKRIEAPRIDDRLRERLVATLRDEVERLRELTGQRFATWQL